MIRSEETTGPVTSLALSAVNKFISYGLIGKDVLFYTGVNYETDCQLPHSSLSSLHHLLPNPKYFVCDNLYCLLDVFRNVV